VDVVVTLIPGSPTAWALTDRLGRNVGRITRSADDRFVINPTNSGSDAPLAKIDAVQPSLDMAMDEIAQCLKGVCQLSTSTD
jgi:hypothetical protein